MMTYGQCRMDAIFCWFQFSKLAHKSCAKKFIGMVGTVDAGLGEFTPGRPNEKAKWEMELSFDIGNGSRLRKLSICNRSTGSSFEASKSRLERVSSVLEGLLMEKQTCALR